MRTSHPRSLIVALAALTLLSAAARADFYQADRSVLHGSPGTIIRSEPLAGAPAGASAYRVLYRSRGVNQEPIAVSGVVIVPHAPPPARGRDVVAWAHPTTGVVSRCAPSLRHNVFRSVPGLAEMLARGFVVTATDYPGLGTAGPHPYLVGLSEGHAVLDAVRAARALPGTAAGDRFAVWGHSQGGHAALFSGELAHAYAPELRLVGVAAAAPATKLAELFEADINTASGRVLTAMALYSWSRVFRLSLDDLIEPTALPAFERTAEACLESLAEFVAIRFTERPLQRGLLRNDPAKLEPWRSIMERNTPRGRLSGAPLFLAQGMKDTLVDPPVTAAYMAELCRQGVQVRFLRMPDVIHGTAARDSASSAVEWMAERFAGAAPANDCGRALARHQGPEPHRVAVSLHETVLRRKQPFFSAICTVNISCLCGE
jgi:acetyl esterase/lipase